MAIKRISLTQRLQQENESALGAIADDKIIMGIDPGTNLMGYAVIKTECGRIEVLIMGVITLGKFSDPYQKLYHIFERLTALISQYKPDEMALEAPFYGTNVQSMLKLGRAQGVAMSAALAQGIDVFEYAPTRVKQAVAGNGRASKEQIAALLQRTLAIEIPEKYDATDALSVAMCHYYTQSSPTVTREKTGNSSSWKTYVNQHQLKITK